MADIESSWTAMPTDSVIWLQSVVPCCLDARGLCFPGLPGSFEHSPRREMKGTLESGGSGRRLRQRLAFLGVQAYKADVKRISRPSKCTTL